MAIPFLWSRTDYLYYIVSRENNSVRAIFDIKKEAKAYLKNNNLKHRYKISKMKLI